jgi:hypothetical protein
MTEEKIKDFIADLYDPEILNDIIYENILNYVDYEQMEDEGIEDEQTWYTDYGRGEAELEIVDDIIGKVGEFLNEPDSEWYFKDKYGDLNEMIYEVFPELNYQ